MPFQRGLDRARGPKKRL